MANFKVQEISDIIRLNKLAIYSILGLFCVLLMPLPAVAATQKSFADLMAEKGPYQIIHGQEIEVCQVYHQNLEKNLFTQGDYPHRIHVDLKETLIHPAPEEWQLLDATQYELLYLRVYNFFRLKYQHFFDSLEEVDTSLYPALDKNHSRKDMFNIWHDTNLYMLDLDVDNDGELETLLGSSIKPNTTISEGTFVIVNLYEQVIDESASRHLLLPRLSLEAQYNKPSRRGGLYNYEFKKLEFQLKEKGYSDEQITKIIENSVFARLGDIEDDFFTYRNKVYVTSTKVHKYIG